MRTSKEDIERYYFCKFVASFPTLVASGKLRQGEKPDFVIDGPRMIGIEITNLYREDDDLSSRQRQQPIRESVIKEAQSRYERMSGRPVRIVVTFDEKNPLDNKTAKSLPERIADFVLGLKEHSGNGALRKNLYSGIPELSWVYFADHYLTCPLPPDLVAPIHEPEDFEAFQHRENRADAHRRQHGIRTPLQQPLNWRVQQGHEGCTMSASRLQEKIRAKDLKCEAYGKCDAYWLLVVIDFADITQEQEILRSEGIDTVRSERFEKVLVYRTAFEQVLEFDMTHNPPSVRAYSH